MEQQPHVVRPPGEGIRPEFLENAADTRKSARNSGRLRQFSSLLPPNAKGSNPHSRRYR